MRKLDARSSAKTLLLPAAGLAVSLRSTAVLRDAAHRYVERACGLFQAARGAATMTPTAGLEQPSL
jgi:hypothetical protein